MYIPDSFNDNDPDALRERITAQPLGTLILNNADGMEANHIPFVLAGEQQDERLIAHIPRANPLSRLTGSHDALVIFHGPQGYISPSWYATKAEHGRVVPTWNYAVTHVYGQLRVVDDTRWVLDQIRQLTDQQEQHREAPWSVDDAPSDYTDKLARHLVGIEISIRRMEGKNKASQNQSDINQASVLKGLESEPASASLLRGMAATLNKHGQND